jgi:hypothetical protein
MIPGIGETRVIRTYVVKISPTYGSSESTALEYKL